MALSTLDPTFLDEVADFLAGQPTREELLDYRPSSQAQLRYEVLLKAARDGQLSHEEAAEMQQFEQAEILIRMIKARLRNHKHV